MAGVTAATPRPFRAASTTEGLRAAVLGANTWALGLLLPSLHAGTRTIDAVLLPVPLVALGIGAWALGRAAPRERSIATVALLVGFPVSVAVVLALRSDLAERDAWGPLGLFALSLSALAYAAMAAEACARPLRLRASTAQDLPTPLTAAEPRARTWLRRLVLGVTTLGALAMVSIAPALGSRTELLRAWGDAADEATVLASIAGAAAGALALAGILGPRLRADRGTKPTGLPRRSVRVALSLLMATLGIVSYLVLRHFEPGAATLPAPS